MKVSVIIAVGTPGEHLRESLGHVLALDYPDYEVIVLPDEPWETSCENVRVIPTGRVRPAEKRDRGAEASKGELLAFLDDDAYPEKDWLSKAVVHFSDDSVGGVGGPGLTPPSDSHGQKISGWIYESPLVSYRYTYRYKPGKAQDVEDYPTSSLILRKDVFMEAGGFDTGYWPGEDTILCMKITHDLKKRIIYDPSVRVYHHRRTVFIPHLNQIASYALHRGFFAKKFPGTSLKPGYFIPSVFAIFFLFGWMTVFLNDGLFLSWATVMGIYAFMALVFSLRTVNPIAIAGILVGTFLTHLTYGIWFMAGLLAKELSD